MIEPSYREWCAFWATGFAVGFQLYEKMPAWFRQAWKILLLASLLPLTAAALLGGGRGCSGAHGAHLVDSSSKWRPLPPLVYIQPDAKAVTPSPALPPVPLSAPKITGPGPSPQTGWIEDEVSGGTVVMLTSPTLTTTTATSIGSFTTGAAATTAITGMQCAANGLCVMTSGATITMATIVSAEARSQMAAHMAAMKYYPASQQPSRCVAHCASHHTKWTTPVEDSYCEKDTSNADGGFYGWVKEGDFWIPNVWPATKESDAGPPQLVRLKDGEQPALTEGKRSY
jgi:hypothetical protein